MFLFRWGGKPISGLYPYRGSQRLNAPHRNSSASFVKMWDLIHFYFAVFLPVTCSLASFHLSSILKGHFWYRKSCTFQTDQLMEDKRNEAAAAAYVSLVGGNLREGLSVVAPSFGVPSPRGPTWFPALLFFQRLLKTGLFKWAFIP